MGTNDFMCPGSGIVPVSKSSWKSIGENAVADKLLIHQKLGEVVKFTQEGMTADEVKSYFDTLFACKGAAPPVVESGGTYGVSDTFHDMNGPLLVHQLKCSPMFEALDAKDRERATAIFEIMFLNRELRNRNPLHPSVVDASVMGNLVNFPKHLFGMGHACYASDGNEALSLVLYAYRERLKKRLKLGALTDQTLRVLYVRPDDNGGTRTNVNVAELRYICQRLTLDLEVVSKSALKEFKADKVLCALVDFESAAIDEVAGWAKARKVGCHIHITDAQLRRILIGNADPVHFKFPAGVQSLSIEEGMLSLGYALYRRFELRDMGIDIPYEWQAAYLSPNEGGSGSTRPLLEDLCTFMLGWGTMRKIAGAVPLRDRQAYVLQPLSLDIDSRPLYSQKSSDEIVRWTMDQMDPKTSEDRITVPELEHDLVRFQQAFMGGERVEGLQCLVSGGGTRSINYAFEALLGRAREALGKKPFQVKILTGNPHFAVERAKRRFAFQLERIPKAGVLDVEKLEQLITDPDVLGVYAQSLSYTDGISDPLAEILEVIEAENIRRKNTPGLELMPVSLINDSCLAFSVIAYHDGKKDKCNMRLLDLSANHITPVLVINDAHKHLGTDKGLSAVIGSRGSLKFLRGCVKVGTQPSRDELLRAVANLHFVGAPGYFRLYEELAQSANKLIECIEGNGLRVMHKHGRLHASSVISVEDPGGCMIGQLKKKGYKLTQIFNFCPEFPNRCQTGWQISMVPHHLRKVTLSNGESAIALDKFMQDVGAVCRRNANSSKFKWTLKLFGQNSYLAYLLLGNETAVMCSLLGRPGFWQRLSTTLIRRFSSAQLDSGTANLAKHKAKRSSLSTLKMAALLVLLFLILRRRFA